MRSRIGFLSKNEERTLCVNIIWAVCPAAVFLAIASVLSFIYPQQTLTLLGFPFWTWITIEAVWISSSLLVLFSATFLMKRRRS